MHLATLWYGKPGDYFVGVLQPGDVVQVVPALARMYQAGDGVAVVVQAETRVINSRALLYYVVNFPAHQKQVTVPREKLYGGWRVVDDQTSSAPAGDTTTSSSGGSPARG